jgi:acyl carrier protein
MESRIRNVMSAVFKVPVDEISDECSPHDIEAWDSLTHMNLVLALENEFGIEFEEDEIPSLVSFKLISITIRGYFD